MEETTKEFHRSASEDPTQTSVPAHHRFYHTRLWQLIRGEIELSANGQVGSEHSGTEDETLADQFATDPVREELQAILDEFLVVLTDYCRNETNPKERLLTLRVTRSELIAALLMRTPPGTEKNVYLTTLIGQALDVFDAELEVIRVEAVEHFATASNPVSNVRWVARGAKAKIVDFANGLLHLEGMSTCDGTELTFSDMVRALGIAFNVDTPNMHVQRYQNKVRYKNAAQFLRRLATLVEKDADDLP